MYLLFDLDGTLTDSQIGITRSVDYALRTVMNIKTEDLSTLTNYIGPPLIDGFMENHHVDLETSKRCVKAYRERYEKIGLLELEVYKGIPEMLETLHKAGFKLAVATSKPEVFAKQILKNINLADYFETVCGATLDGKIDTKDAVIAEVLNRLNDLDKDNCLMIGDRKHDIEGAKKHNINGIGVLWGFGTKKELENAGAYKLFKTPNEFTNWIISKKDC